MTDDRTDAQAPQEIERGVIEDAVGGIKECPHQKHGWDGGHDAKGTVGKEEGEQEG